MVMWSAGLPEVGTGRIGALLVALYITTVLGGASVASATEWQTLSLGRATIDIHVGCSPQTRHEGHMQQLQCMWGMADGGVVIFSMTEFFFPIASLDSPELDLRHAFPADRRTYLEWALESTLRSLEQSAPPEATSQHSSTIVLPDEDLPPGADSCRSVQMTQSGDDPGAPSGKRGFILEKRGLWCAAWVGEPEGLVHVVPLLVTSYRPGLGEAALPDFASHADEVMRTLSIRR